MPEQDLDAPMRDYMAEMLPGQEWEMTLPAGTLLRNGTRSVVTTGPVTVRGEVPSLVWEGFTVPGSPEATEWPANITMHLVPKQDRTQLHVTLVQVEDAEVRAALDAAGTTEGAAGARARAALGLPPE